MTNPRTFWNNKILNWEAGRYGEREGVRKSILERLADRSSSSLQRRQQLAVDLIARHVKGRCITEIGCGSGLLAERLISAGAESYVGVDISDVAIEAAHERISGSAMAGRITFAAAPVDAMPDLHPDAIVVSFGLLDWLNDGELASLFARQGGRDFLHSFSERRASPSQLLHRLYVYAAYGHRTGAYVPR